MQIILENSVLSQVYQYLLRLFFLVGGIYLFIFSTGTMPLEWKVR